MVLLFTSFIVAFPVPVAIASMLTCIPIQLLVLTALTTGAALNGTSTICDNCPDFKSFLSCDPITCDWLLLNGYWAGNTSVGGPLVVGGCPLGFCAFNASGEHVWIPSDMTHVISDFACNQTNRMGILCASCKPGFAPAINTDTFDCVPCNSRSSRVNWIYYVLSVYIPLFLVFLFIIVFNVSLTTGPLNAFILYAQVLATTLNLNAQGPGPLSLVYGAGSSAFGKSYQIPYDLFNLNLFVSLLPPYCLSETLNTLDIISLKYLEALFAILMILLITLVIRCQDRLKCASKVGCCKRRKSKMATSLVQAFAAFVLLSYNRLCVITIVLLAPVRIVDNLIQTVERRVYYNGDILYTDSNYSVRYKLLAFLFLLLLIVLPITLLHYPVRWLEWLVGRVRCLRRAYPAASVAILLDTFQGCFKDNRRYFAGLYLALRLLLFFAFSLTLLQQLLLQQVIITMYIFFLGFLQPYKSKYLNYLDISIFLNMALVNMLEFYVASTNQTETDTVPLMICIVFESILIFLPMAYFCCYVVWYGTRKYHHRVRQRLLQLYKKLLRKDKSAFILNQELQSADNDDLLDELGYSVISDDSATPNGNLEKST